MTRSRNGPNSRRQISPVFEWLELTGGDVRPQNALRSLEHWNKECRGRLLVGVVQPVIRVPLANPDDRVGESNFPINHHAANMIFMEMCQEHLIDLFRLVAGSVQVLKQTPTARAVKRAGAGVDQNELGPVLIRKALIDPSGGARRSTAAKAASIWPGLALDNNS